MLSVGIAKCYLLELILMSTLVPLKHSSMLVFDRDGVNSDADYNSSGVAVVGVVVLLLALSLSLSV